MSDWNRMSVEQKLDALRDDIDTLFNAVEDLQRKRPGAGVVEKLAMQIFEVRQRLGMN